MANDNHANYARIGGFIIFGIVLILITLAWLGGAGGKKNEFLAETFFSNDVSGLDVGSAVNLRGVRVGSVKRISFLGAVYDVASHEDRRKIHVLLALDKRLFRVNQTENPQKTLEGFVSRGLHATVSSSGVTGLSHIELNFPKGKVVDEKIAWTPENVTIPPAPSILQSAADSATQILDQINRMDLLAAWTNIVGTLENANSTLASLGTLLESNGGNVGEILDNLRETSASLRDFANDIKSNPSLLIRSNDPDRLQESR